MHISRLADSIASIRHDVLAPDAPFDNKDAFSAIALRSLIVGAIQKGLVAWFRELHQIPAPVGRLAAESGGRPQSQPDEVRIYILLSVDAAPTTGGSPRPSLTPRLSLYLEPLGSLSGHGTQREVIVEIPGAPPRASAKAKDSAWVRDRLPLERRKGADAEEVLLQTTDGLITEGLSSNFFVVMRDGTVRTASEGILSGTVRRAVLDVLSEEKIPCDLRPPSLAEHHLWKEAFITSTSRMVMPIATVRVWASAPASPDEPLSPPSFVLTFPGTAPTCADGTATVAPRVATLVQARLGQREAQPVWSPPPADWGAVFAPAK